MALVTVTGNAWQGDRKPIPSDLGPELVFRPICSTIAGGLFTANEVVAEWTGESPGEFSVRLESQPELLYVPVLRWRVPDPREVFENWARKYEEWDPIFPGNGGPIGQLPGVVKLGGVWYGIGEPPEVLKRRNDVIYLDITGPGVGVWAPAGAKYAEGVVI